MTPQTDTDEEAITPELSSENPTVEAAPEVEGELPVGAPNNAQNDAPVGAPNGAPNGAPTGASSEEISENAAEPQNTEEPDHPEKVKSAAEKAAEQHVPAKPLKVNKTKSQVAEHFFRTPEDPSFMYETRYIPGHKNTEEFLSKELEKEVIVERIQEEQDFRKSLQKIKINMPDYRQMAVVAAVIGLFVLYRFRVKGMRRKTRYK